MASRLGVEVSRVGKAGDVSWNVCSEEGARAEALAAGACEATIALALCRRGAWGVEGQAENVLSEEQCAPVAAKMAAAMAERHDAHPLQVTRFYMFVCEHIPREHLISVHRQRRLRTNP